MFLDDMPPAFFGAAPPSTMLISTSTCATLPRSCRPSFSQWLATLRLQSFESATFYFHLCSAHAHAEFCRLTLIHLYWLQPAANCCSSCIVSSIIIIIIGFTGTVRGREYHCQLEPPPLFQYSYHLRQRQQRRPYAGLGRQPTYIAALGIYRFPAIERHYIDYDAYTTFFQFH